MTEPVVTREGELHAPWILESCSELLAGPTHLQPPRNTGSLIWAKQRESVSPARTLPGFHLRHLTASHSSPRRTKPSCQGSISDLQWWARDFQFSGKLGNAWSHSTRFPHTSRASTLETILTFLPGGHRDCCALSGNHYTLISLMLFYIQLALWCWSSPDFSELHSPYL